MKKYVLSTAMWVACCPWACSVASVAEPSLVDAAADALAEDTLGARGVEDVGADTLGVEDVSADTLVVDTMSDTAEAGADSGADGSLDDDLPMELDSLADAAALPDVSEDTSAPALCADCPVDQQPKANHPGAKGPCALLEPLEVSYGAGFSGAYKKARVFRPVCAGPHPVVFFVHGKSLYQSGGLVGATLGGAYQALLEHVASRGYVAAFVRVEQGLLDADHARMADDLLDATEAVFKNVSIADKTKVTFAGHSMGAKVVLIAAAKTYAEDPSHKYVNPRVVQAFSVSNEPPPFGTFVNAVEWLKKLPASAQLSLTFVQPADDKIAPMGDPSKPNAKALYAAAPIAHKQLIVLHGTGKDDPNPATSPELHDDHAAALTITGKPGGLADFAMPNSYLDALDWYGFWKLLVGALDFHFKQGSIEWAYGTMRTHGGTTPQGAVVTHEVLLEQGKATP